MPKSDAATSVFSLSNSALPARDRFGWYIDVVCQRIAPLSLASPYARDFTARVVSTDLGAAQLAGFSFPPLDAVRTLRHIRRDGSGPETYMLGLIQRVPMQVAQQRESVAVDAGELVLFNMSHPLKATFPDFGPRAVVTILRLPRASFPLPSDQTDRLLARPLSTRSATGSLLRHFMGSTLGQAADQPTAENQRLGPIAVDLAAAFLAGHLDAGNLLPAETRRRALVARIDAFIEANLSDPGLTPTAIASQHHISVRALHQLFSNEAESVMATVRRRRLERCREALAAPVLRQQPIGVLAAQWGFTSPAEFSRVFKRAYGATPRQFRHEISAAQSPR
ncbi:MULTISPECIES: helix-turn-helix domain-containing protein [unclassified Streptomyces]|uniref:helix-turn-helix domain-containing protein n=1 Tax=unclassified Streptomyces TaxID=2593676 RepID=UPI003688C57A